MKNNDLHKDANYFLAKWLEGDITDQQVASMLSSEEFLAYKKLKEGIDTFGYVEQPLDASFDAIQARIASIKNKTTKVRYLQWGAAIAASVVLFFGLYNGFMNTSVHFATEVAEQKSVILLDTSEVILNAKSQLTYDKTTWETNRDVSLNGEAIFKVAKGSSFSVHTANGVVTVLGTEFNVNSNEDYFQVSCYEGSVRVTVGEEDYVLAPGDVLRRINGNHVEEWVDARESPAWLEDESQFKSVPLKYVIHELEKQFDIQVQNDQIDTTKIFTGSFSHQNLNLALASVFKTMQIHYQVVSGNQVVLSYHK